MRALPIPDSTSPIRFKDLQHAGESLTALLQQLGAKQAVIDAPVHLDPDVVTADLPRDKDWRPVFGQSGAAQFPGSTFDVPVSAYEAGALRDAIVTGADVHINFGTESGQWKAGRWGNLGNR